MSICCRNECEDLLRKLEVEIAAPTAETAQILALVQKLSSPTVQGPRVLSATLLRRLEEIAGANGGAIPIHGRLFSQWMHHAFPLECPFPHVTGTVNPQTPDEWMRQSGHEGHQVSEHEMRSYVVKANGVLEDERTRQFNIGETDEVDVAELHWSDVEESFCGAGAAPVVPRVAESEEHAVATFNIGEHDEEADAMVLSLANVEQDELNFDDLPWVDAEGRERPAQPPVRLSGAQIVAPPPRGRLAMWRLGGVLALVTTCGLGIVILAPEVVLMSSGVTTKKDLPVASGTDGKSRGASYFRALLLTIGGIKLFVLVAAADAHGWLDRVAFFGALAVGAAATIALAAVRMVAPVLVPQPRKAKLCRDCDDIAPIREALGP